MRTVQISLLVSGHPNSKQFLYKKSVLVAPTRHVVINS